MATNDDSAARPGSSRPPVPPPAAGADSQSGGETTPAGRSPSMLPEVFGRYRVKWKLGGGGMGTVYLVENTQLHREEALRCRRWRRDRRGIRNE